MKKLFMLFALGFVISLSACSSNSDEVKIGLNYELSGPVASYGIVVTNGIKLAVEEAGQVLGKDIKLIEYDNKSTTDEVVSIFTKLATQDNVSVILGPATSGNTKASVPLSAKYEVPLVSASATADNALLDANGKVSPYAYRTCFNDSFQGTVHANFISSDLNGKKVAILGDSSSDYSLGLTKSFKDQYKKNGGVVVAEESYIAGDTDFNAVITKLKQSEFDVLYVPGYYDEAGLIIKQAREAGLNVPVVGGDGFESEVLTELAGKENLNNVYYSSHSSTADPSAEMSAFIKAYKEKYGEEPNAFAALGYDLGKFTVDAVKRANSSDPVKINEAMAKTVDFKGVTGTFSIDENHNPVKSIFVIGLKNGEADSAKLVNP